MNYWNNLTTSQKPLSVPHSTWQQTTGYDENYGFLWMSHKLINIEDFSHGCLIPHFSFVRVQPVHSISRKEHPVDSKNNN